MQSSPPGSPLVSVRTAERNKEMVQMQEDGGALGEGSSRRGKVISAESAVRMTAAGDRRGTVSYDSGQSAVSIPAQTGQKSSAFEIPDPGVTKNELPPLCSRACFRFPAASPMPVPEQPQPWPGMCRKKLPASRRSRKTALNALNFFRIIQRSVVFPYYT